MLKKIKNIGEVRIDEIDERLRDVTLRGFPDVKIYEDSDISIREVTPDWVKEKLFTPQPTIYRKDHLDRIENMACLFFDEGIDIFQLNQGYDYTAVDENEGETDWTIIPPVVEFLPVDFGKKGEKGLNYSSIIGQELRSYMQEKEHRLNSELNDLDFEEYEQFSGMCSIPLICDGSHRIHSGLEEDVNQNLLFLSGSKMGFPYYAAPKPYSCVHVESERPEGGGSDKTHIISEPGHKALYRLFPTGNILSGSVRPTSKNVN